MTKQKRVSTKSLVNNSAFVNRPGVMDVSRLIEERVSEAVEDVCQFHRYLDKIYLRQDYDLCKRLYGKMRAISEKYPSSNSLKNKLDEAERYVWPHGRLG